MRAPHPSAASGAGGVGRIRQTRTPRTRSVPRRAAPLPPPANGVNLDRRAGARGGRAHRAAHRGRNQRSSEDPCPHTPPRCPRAPHHRRRRRDGREQRLTAFGVFFCKMMGPLMARMLLLSGSAAPLPRLSIRPNSTTVSGEGHGGDHAVQAHTAWSAAIGGVCGFSAQPVFCAAQRFTREATVPWGSDRGKGGQL